jgi:hypothetical protein
MITRHEVTFPYTKEKREALFRLAYADGLARDGRYRVRPVADRSEWLPAVRQWTAWWQYQDDTTGAMHGHSWEESDLMGAFLVHWGEAPAVWQIEVQEDYTLQEVLQALGRLELQALHDVKHGQAPPEK